MTEHNKKSHLKVLITIFLTSVSLFNYQIILTRLYSAVLSYHFVFLITSIAILGLGIGSILAYCYKRVINEMNLKTNEKIKYLTILLSISYIMIFSIIYFIPYVSSLILYTLFGIIPFIVGGFLYATLFTEFSSFSSKLYFADLIGSGLGSFVVIFLLNFLGITRSILVISILAFIPSILFQFKEKRRNTLSYVLPILLITLLMTPYRYINFIETNFNGILNNNNKTYGSLKESGADPEIVYSKWNAFSRTDVIKIKNDDEMIVTIDGSANAPMYKFDGNVESLSNLKTEIGYLPFTIGSNDKTLVIGPGGGRDVLYAIAGGSKEIDAVEINTSSIEAVKEFSDYNGNIYNRPEVSVYGEDGRSFVRSTNKKYDLIYLSLVMTNTTQGIGYSLSENYIYTIEALDDYFNKLNENGKVAFLTHGEEDFSKIIATIILALEKKGVTIEEIPNYISVFSYYMQSEHGGYQMHSPVVLVKNTPFSENESQELLDISKKNKIYPIYIPFVNDQGPLNGIKEGNVTMSDFLKGFNFNVKPATDDSPYFYNFNKGAPEVLIFLLIIVVLGSGIMFLPFTIKHHTYPLTTYFGLLGIGFMMIEVPVIQKFILYLGHPTLAFTCVLSALLIGSGIGGFFSDNRIFNRIRNIFYIPPLMVVLINIILVFSLNIIFQKTSDFEISVRIIFTFIIVMVQGFFMGMPFPRGLKLVSISGRNEIIPILWGINGVTSVIGSVLSVVMSMTIGFNWTFIIGVVIYFIISFYKSL